MNIKILFFIISLVTIPLHLFAQDSEEYFKIEIEQNGKILKKKDNVFSLEKSPFKFKVTLYKVDVIEVSSSWGKYYYDYPENENIYECNDGSFFEGCRFVAIKTGNQDKFNEAKNLAVGDGDYQWAWFYYEHKDWHRFDKGVTKKDGVIYAEMTVENIYDCDTRDEKMYDDNSKKSDYDYNIENIDKDIYMVFGASHYEKGMKYPKELQREKFILRFK